MPRPWLSRASLAVASTVLFGLTACGPALPPSVVEGSVVRVGWSQDLTSTNVATQPNATVGNLDVAAMTRDQFAQLVDGEVKFDDGFGTVEIIESDPFTVRYDLAEVMWSDGIPIDAADLLLAWAAGSNALAPEEFDSTHSELTHSDEPPEYDEFDRRIDIRFSRPVRAWQTALDVAVPAHVVGALALEVDDPMEAKQAVITAIEDRDTDALAAMARTWNTGFDLSEVDGDDMPPELLLSSGPYRLDSIERSGSGTERVRLAVNREYAGAAVPSYEHIDLVRSSASDPLADLGEDLDVVQVAPTADNREPIRFLERRDHHVAHSHTGEMWVLVVRADRGVFRERKARLAFLRAVPRSDVRTAGAGAWRDAYASTNALLFPPGGDGYQIALEDAGFRATLDQSVGDGEEERKAAGVPGGTAVCVLYDTDEAFAAAAFAELRSGVAEAGWRVTDCGDQDVRAATEGSDDWDAVLTTVPVPERPEEIAVLWGSGGLSGVENEQRDRLIAKLGSIADEYVARDLRVLMEASIVRDAVAVPVAMRPLVTVAQPDIEGVQPRSGPWATLTSGAADWSPTDD